MRPESDHHSAVCTLFEGDFHHGLAALANSLYAAGFRGTIWAGGRGDIPRWAKGSKPAGRYEDFTVAPGCVIRFVTCDTTASFFNYKPNFLLSLWEEHAIEADRIFYFDADITVCAQWQLFEDWVQQGLALCEDIASPIPKDHPWRQTWTEYFGAQGFPYHPRHDIYVNSGFIGFAKGHIDFLRLWKRLQELLAPALGGLQSRPSLDGKSPFCFPDQCALNVALESTPHPMILLGKEGMGFRPYRATLMMHGVGYPKPWHEARWPKPGDRLPMRADIAYWSHLDGPIRLCHPLWSVWQRLVLSAEVLAADVLIGFVMRLADWFKP